ncbi:MAG: hypothetical protein IRZ16_17125 [Myxococcaceae bacterium]|nr:hypothetical protein [Myxococcaceae bacterium]
MKRAVVVVSSALAVGAFSGCATTRSRFPIAEELNALAASPPAPVPAADRTPVTLQEWTLKGPFPESVAPLAHPNDSIFDRAFLPLLFERGAGPSAQGGDVILLILPDAANVKPIETARAEGTAGARREDVSADALSSPDRRG